MTDTAVRPTGLPRSQRLVLEALTAHGSPATDDDLARSLTTTLPSERVREEMTPPRRVVDIPFREYTEPDSDDGWQVDTAAVEALVAEWAPLITEGAAA